MDEVVATDPAQNTNTPAPAAEQKPPVAAAAAPGAAPAADPAKAEPTLSAKSVVPEKYDLKLPEGSTLDASSVEKIASFAKERGLSNEQAQAILERDHEAKASFDEANKPGTGSEWIRRTSDMEKAALADKEIGGTKENLLANCELGKQVLTKFFPENVTKFLVDTGFGSHPDVIRGFAKLGKMMAPDQLVIPGASAGNKRAMEDIFYGNTKKE